MKRLITVIMAVLGCLSLIQAQGCTTAKASKMSANSNNTIEVSREAPEFTIRLDSNPTTGYSWSAKQYDGKLLTLVNSEFFPPNSNCIGASGYEIWTFRANLAAFTASTTTRIEMRYARSWEKQGDSKTATFTVSLKP